MQQVILVIHLMVVTALVALVLYQKSEGSALGMGQSGFFSGRGQANALTRATAILATIFFVTSIALTVLPAWERRSKGGDDWTTAIDQPKVEFKEIKPGAPGDDAAKGDKPKIEESKDSIFDQLKRAQEKKSAPAPEAPKAIETPRSVEAPAPEAAQKPAEAPAAAETDKPALRPTTQDAAPIAAPAVPALPEAAAPAPSAPVIWKSPSEVAKPADSAPAPEAPKPAEPEKAPEPAANAPTVWKAPKQ